MERTSIVVIDYGMGNIHSILKALRLYHDRVLFTDDPEEIRNAKALVLPGDGAFGAAMEHLRKKGLDRLIRDHVEAGGALLGVCIGFQVLFADSDETHGEEGILPGLGLLPGSIRRFRFTDPSVRVPHMGWNVIHSPAGAMADEYMYFIHSYRAQSVPAEFVDTTCDYAGDQFVSSVRKGSIFATQFHPEKSDRAGLQLLKNWVRSLDSVSVSAQEAKDSHGAGVSSDSGN